MRLFTDTLCTNRVRHFAAHWKPQSSYMCVQRPRRRATPQKGGPPSQRSQGGCLVQLGRRDSPRTLLHAYSWCANHTKASTPSHWASGSAPLLRQDRSEEPTSTEGRDNRRASPGPRRRWGQVQCKQVGRARENTCPILSTQTAYRASSESCGIQVSAAPLLAQTARNVGRMWRLIIFCPRPNSAGCAPRGCLTSRQPIHLGRYLK